MDKRIFLSPPHMSGKEREYIDDVFKSNYIAPVGKFIDRFEDSIKCYTGSKYALALSSATASLHLALRVLDIKEGDYVLASSLTFIGSVSAILYERATPVFIDSNYSWNLDPELLKEAILKLPKRPKALILTHLYGQMAEIDEIANICKENNIYLIEDSAESLGATFGGKPSGTFGDLGVFSFNGNKILTTSGGGVLVSDNKEWISRARKLSTQARENFLHYEHIEYGYNYRMSNLLASIGVAQMEVLEDRVEKKREIFEFYRRELKDIGDIEFMPEISNSRGNRWLTTLTLRRDPKDIILALDRENIEARPVWKPMHMQPLFRESISFLNGISEDIFSRGLCLPSPTALKDTQLYRVVEVIKKYVK
jgi:UDP-N-acetylbacillosamine transaminase